MSKPPSRSFLTIAQLRLARSGSGYTSVQAMLTAATPAMTSLIANATDGTAQQVPAADGVREFAYGGYVDEVVAYRQTVGGVVGTYYPHYNHLYSVAARIESGRGLGGAYVSEDGRGWTSWSPIAIIPAGIRRL